MQTVYEALRTAAESQWPPETTHVEAVLMTQSRDLRSLEPSQRLGESYDVPAEEFRALLERAVVACDGRYDATRCVRKYVADAQLFTDIDGCRAPRAERGRLLARHQTHEWNVCAWKRDKIHPLQFPCVGPYDHECCCEVASFRLGGGWRLVFEAQQGTGKTNHRVMIQCLRRQADGLTTPTGRGARPELMQRSCIRALEQVFSTPR